MGKFKSKGLMGALQSHQERAEVKRKILQAAQAAQLKSQKNGQSSRERTNSITAGPAKPKTNSQGTLSKQKRRTTIPFFATDKILLIGEGNFSFALSLVVDPPPELRSLLSANITATSYDSESDCYRKYPESQRIVASLKDKGVQVIFNVDGTKLELNTSSLRGRRYDRIVWNFPHAGRGITDQDRNILTNQVMLVGFLRSASSLLALGPVPAIAASRKKKKHDNDDDDSEPEAERQDDSLVLVDDDDEYQFFTPQEERKRSRGTILITLRNVPPYTAWDLPRLAKHPRPPTWGNTPPNPPYTLLRSFVFHRDAWKGYEHRMTKGERAYGTGTTGQGGEDRTWEFCLRDVD